MTHATLESRPQSTASSATARYAKAIEASKRVRWNIDTDFCRPGS